MTISVPVQLRNKSTAADDTIITHGIRLPQGELSGSGRRLKVIDGSSERDVQWEPFGEVYPDGTYSQIAVHYPASLTATEDRQVTVTEGAGVTQPFALHSSAINAQNNVSFSLTVEGETRTIRLAEVLATAQNPNAQAHEAIGSGANACLRRYILRRRWLDASIPANRGIWWEVTVEMFSGKDHAKVFVTWGYSWAQEGINLGNPWNTRQRTLTQPVTLVVDGCGSFFIGEDKKFANISRVGTTATYRVIDPNLLVTLTAINSGTKTITVSTPVTLAAGSKVHIEADGLATPANYGDYTVASTVTNSTTFVVTEAFAGNETAVSVRLWVPSRGTGDSALRWIYRHDRLVQGMSHCVEGRLLFNGQAIPSTNANREGASAMAMNWATVGVPPFGTVPGYSPVITTRGEAISRLVQYEDWLYSQGADADPYTWGAALGASNTGNTGNQGIAFGTMRLWLVFLTGYPALLGVLNRDMRQEFCRPNNNRKPNATADLWDYSEHPELGLWNGVPFKPPKVSSGDLLGVNALDSETGIADYECPNSVTAGPVYGWDRQHAMLMVECAVALISANYSALTLFQNYAQIWLGNCDTESPIDGVRSNEVGRAFGRGIMRCGVDIFAVTGRIDVFNTLVARIRSANGLGATGLLEAYHHAVGRPGITVANFMTSMGGFDDVGPGNQSGSLETVQHCYPWNDAIAACNVEACARLLERRIGATATETIYAKLMAADLAMQVTLYGWLDARGLDPDKYRVYLTDKNYNEISTDISRLNIVGKTVTGAGGNTGVVVGLVETDANICLWLKGCTGALWTTGTQALTFAASSFSCNAVGVVDGFIGLKARVHNAAPLYSPITTAQVEATTSITAYQPRREGQNYILACTKASPPVLTLGSAALNDNHFLATGQRIRIAGEPAWTSLNGDWTVTVIDAQRVSLQSGNTTGESGSYVSNDKVQIKRLIWHNKNIKPYTGYATWQLVAAAVAEVYAVLGLYGAKSVEVATKARTILDWFGASRSVDVDSNARPRWNDIDEHVAIRDGVFAVTTSPPSAPINLRATATSATEELLTWTNTATNATAIECEYRRATDQVWTRTSPISATSAQTNLTGLSSLTAYLTRIRATNAVGASAWTNPVAFTTAPPASGGLPPEPPSDLSLTGATNHSFNVSWTNLSDASSGEVQYRVSPSGPWLSVIVQGNTQGVTISQGLLPSTTYNVRVRNFVGGANGVATDFVGPLNITTLSNPVGNVPNPPRPVSAVGGTKQIVLTWADGGGSPATGSYEVNTVDQFGTLTPIALVTAPTVTLTHSGLQDGQTVVYAIRAQNTVGWSAFSPTIIGKTNDSPPPPGTVIPSSPTGLRQRQARATGQEIEWVASAGATSYVVERYVAQDLPKNKLPDTFDEPFKPFWKVIGTTTAPITTFNDVGPLDPDTSYSYRVSASNVAGTSSPSSTLVAKTAKRLLGTMAHMAKRLGLTRRRPIFIDWEWYLRMTASGGHE